MPIPAAFCLFRTLLLISLSIAGCVVSTDYADLAPEQALPHLRAVLKDPNPELRRTAAQSLGKIARKEAVPALVAALGGMEAHMAVPFLTKLLADRDAQIRRWAVGALGEIAAPETVAPLSKVLTKDPDPGVRIEAAFRLGKFGGEAARPALTSALKDANADVRRLANAALEELAGGGHA